MGAPTPAEPEPAMSDEGFDKAIRTYRSYPWMIEEIKDERARAFVVERIWKIEQKLTLGGPQQKERGWKNPYRKDYKPQLGPNGEKIGTPRNGARYEDMETSLACMAWFYDHPDEPLPRWLYHDQTQWFIAQYKKTHKY